MTDPLPKNPTVPRRTNFRRCLHMVVILLGLPSFGVSKASAEGCFGKEWDRLECASGAAKLTAECTQFLDRFHDGLSNTLRSSCEQNTCTSPEKAICSYLYRAASTRHRGTEKECDSELGKTKGRLASCQGEKSAAEGRGQKIQQDLDLVRRDAAQCHEALANCNSDCNRYWKDQWDKFQQEKNALSQRLSHCQSLLEQSKPLPHIPQQGKVNSEVSDCETDLATVEKKLQVSEQTEKDLRRKIAELNESIQQPKSIPIAGMTAGKSELSGNALPSLVANAPTSGTPDLTLDKFATGALWSIFSATAASAITLGLLNEYGGGDLAAQDGRIDFGLFRPAWALAAVSGLTLTLAIPYTVLSHKKRRRLVAEHPAVRQLLAPSGAALRSPNGK